MRTTPMKRSLNNAYVQTSGPVVFPTTPTSRSTIPSRSDLLSLLGYIAPLVVITAGYALFQAANNTVVMTTSRPEQRGVISGLLNLSRNLGLITGASVMAAVFAFGSATTSLSTARPAAVAAGMQLTFSVAAALIVVALAIASLSYALSRRTVRPNRQ
jgi:hypothetical protein